MAYRIVISYSMILSKTCCQNTVQPAAGKDFAK